MKALIVLLASLLVCFSFTTFAGSPDPVLNQPLHEQIAADELVKKFVRAGLVRGWQIKEEGENKLIAEIHVRSHYVAVDIILHGDSYDITYRDSENMRYNEKTGFIHRKYKGWVANLNNDIQRELLK